MTFQGGVKEAAKMLAGLNSEQRLKILEKISLKDPRMAEILKRNIVSFEDLKLMTAKMIPDFLRKINISDLGLVLRRSDFELKEFFLSKVSSGIKEEIQLILDGPPHKASLIDEAENRIMEVARAMIDKGEIVLNSDSQEKYV